MDSDKALDVIENIKQAGGHTKLAILRQHSTIGPYLVAAYDPYTKYHIKKAPAGTGENVFNLDTWNLLNQLSNRVLTGLSAFNAVEAHVQRMTAKSAYLFHMILNKDLRMGMGVKSINKVFPGLIPTHDIMKAKLYEPGRLKYPCYGSPKMDGVRAIFKNGTFYSSGGHPYKGLEHLEKALWDIKVKIDVELTVIGKSFQVGSGLIRSDNLTPNAQVHILELPTINESFTERINMMEELCYELNNSHIVYVPRTIIGSDEGIMEYYRRCRRLGFEGSIVSPYDYEYVGHRSFRWMKLKPVKDIDTRVIDIYEGEGKYKGYLGGVVVMFKGKPNKVGGGFSDQQRFVFWNDPTQIMNKMIEVHYMEETDDGNMRHSRFFDFRQDKEE